MSAAVTWYRRSGLLYAVGGWSAFGGVLYWFSSYPAKSDEQLPPRSPPPGNEMCSVTTVSEDGLKKITTYYSPDRSCSADVIMVYKPNFVPYTTRLYNYVQSFFDNSSGKEK